MAVAPVAAVAASCQADHSGLRTGLARGASRCLSEETLRRFQKRRCFVGIDVVRDLVLLLLHHSRCSLPEFRLSYT